MNHFGWELSREDGSWWLRDLPAAASARTGRTATGIHDQPITGNWHRVPYAAGGWEGRMLQASPTANAPGLEFPLPPVAGTFSLEVGMLENYCDQILLRLDGERAFDRLAPMPGDANALPIQLCPWRVIEPSNRTLVVAQDTVRQRRAAIACLRLAPAEPPPPPTLSILGTIDGWLGNSGNVGELDDMTWRVETTESTHIDTLCHGTDLCGMAMYSTALPRHRYDCGEMLGLEHCWEHATDALRVLRRFEREQRDPLGEAIAAAHRAGKRFHGYHRMALLSCYPPLHLFANTFYERHPEWRCVDHDGTPVARLSAAFPEVRKFFIEHFTEVVSRGADGICPVFVRGVPLVLSEEPVRKLVCERTGKTWDRVSPGNPCLMEVRAGIVTAFMKELRDAIRAVRPDADIVAVVPATPETCRHFALDPATWIADGLIDALCPYAFGADASFQEIDAAAWIPLCKDKPVRLCPILNTFRPEPAVAWLDRAEHWLDAGVDGLGVWDVDARMIRPDLRLLLHALGTPEAYPAIRKQLSEMPRRIPVQSIGGTTVDRYPPGWNL